MLRKIVFKNPEKYSSICFTFAISLLLAIFLYTLTYYIHEGGHILFGSLENLIFNRTIAKFEISNWIESPFHPSIKLPQQTRIVKGRSSLNFMLGGIFMVVLFYSFISCILYKDFKENIILFIPIIFFLHEILGNFLCGTDNFQSKPYEFCTQTPYLDNFIAFFPIVVTIPIFVILLPEIESFMKRKFAKRRLNIFKNNL